MKRALVTGAARRVGRAIAIELGKQGFDVLVHCHRSVEAAQSVVGEIEAAGGRGAVFAADVGTGEGCTALVDAVKARWDGLEILVNNASVFEPRPFEETDLEHWNWMDHVNLRAPFLLSRDLLPLLRNGSLKAGSDACIVNLCDIGADRPVKGYTAYSVSKAGLVMLTKSLALELAPQIRVVGVSPGQVCWPEDYSASKRETLAKRIPMGRAGEPEDVARLVRFLALEGDYLNGLIVPVDGGLHARY